MRSISGKCGHVKRQLRLGKRLEGKVLEFALSLVDGRTGGPFDDLMNGIAGKLKTGETLSDYEHHIMVDVILLHTRLGGA